jgi:hypothetical protein
VPCGSGGRGLFFLKKFERHPNKSVFAFSLKLCKISFAERDTGTLLKNNV